MNIEDAKLHVNQTINMSQNSNVVLKKRLDKAKYIVIYGAGNVGQQLFNSLTIADYKVFCFFDRAAQEGQMLLGVPVYKADEIDREQDIKEKALIIIAMFQKSDITKNIANYLLGLGYRHVVREYSLLGVCLNENFEREQNCIFRALSLMCDDASLDVFCSNLRAHATCSYDDTYISKNTTQYFDVNIPFCKGYSCFVDCGAFTGDSLESSLNYQNIETYIAFEPDANNFRLLCDTVNRFQDKLNTALLYFSGIASHNGYVTFHSGAGSVSYVSQEGNQVIQLLRLDDVLKKITPTMIKMDIEGGEIDALHGAKHIIQTHKPDLAICVYHKVSDIWKIPLLLNELVPEYKFYLRCHQDATIETVLYATI